MCCSCMHIMRLPAALNCMPTLLHCLLCTCSVQAKRLRKPELALPARLSELLQGGTGLCPLSDGEMFHRLDCVLGKCPNCSMSNCITLDPSEELASAEQLDLDYYGYTTQTDADGNERKFLDLKVGTAHALQTGRVV